MGKGNLIISIDSGIPLSLTMGEGQREMGKKARTNDGRQTTEGWEERKRSPSDRFLPNTVEE